MKPIEKYEEKFIALLKEAEEELGEGLQVRVMSTLREVQPQQYAYATTYKKEYKKEYKFELGTTGYYG